MEQLKHNYQERLDTLHQFLYCELPLKLMNNEEDHIDLQDKLYNLIEQGYVKDLETRYQKAMEENYLLANKENTNTYNSNTESDTQKILNENRLMKKNLQDTQLEIQNVQIHNQQLNDELVDKNTLLNEIQEKMENFETLSEALLKAEKAIQELADENIQLSEQLDCQNQQIIQYKEQIDQLQQIIETQELQQSKEESEIKENIQILQDEFSQWEQKKLSLIQIVNNLKELIREQLNQLRIELDGLLAEIKIRAQITEQFQSQMESDLIKGFHQILSRVKQTYQGEINELKSQLITQKEEYVNQINKMKKDIQFYKVLEGEYEQKLGQALNQRNECESQLQLKETQLNDIVSKLDVVQQNIQQTEQFYQNQIAELENYRDRKSLQMKQFKNQMKLKMLNIQKQLELMREDQQYGNQQIEQLIAKLEIKLIEENKSLIEGLSSELSQSIDTIKKQHYQIRQLELEFSQYKLKNAVPIIPDNPKLFDKPQDTKRSSSGLEEQRKYLNTLKEIHQKTKSQLRNLKHY